MDIVSILSVISFGKPYDINIQKNIDDQHNITMIYYIIGDYYS